MEEKRRAILAGANLNNGEDFIHSMKELLNLADACEIDVVGEITQNLGRINSVTYFGKGKVQELSEYILEQEGDMVIFNDELSPSQIRNLEDALNCMVIDRTVLILDIFANRAKTKEAQLQVETAKLHYMLPRLSGSGMALGRQGGGAGLRNRGTGETKLELDRRKIEDRISALEKELESLVARRQNQRKKRGKKEIPVVALVGYTNAGKSTIMNSMLNFTNSTEDKQVFEKDMLFATLETSVRNILLEDNKSFLLTDTVGFISKLPHHLVKAFRSTLEEVTEADLLLHVVDYSDSNYKMQMNVTKETLKELGANQIPTLNVYNKIDLVEDFKNQDRLDIEGISKEDCFISGKQKEGIGELIGCIKEIVFADYVKTEMLLPYDKGNLVAYFNENATVFETKYENEGIYISLECGKSDYHKYQQYEITNKK